MNRPDPESLRQRLLVALAENRNPGFHFPGYFLQLWWPHIGRQEIVHALESGPHCLNADGTVNPAVLGLVVDTALATAPRLVIEPGARQATTQLSVQFTGNVPRGDIRMDASLEGFFSGASVRQALTRGVMTSEDRTVCYATATFVLLPPPPGVQLAPLPWQRKDERSTEPLVKQELTAAERAVLRTADAALARSDSEHAFIERFWGILPRATATGATCRVKIGPHIGNRVGHVQGGILFGLVCATAAAGVPRHPAISSVSMWFISPGHGKSLTVRSKIIHSGRSFAVVRTEIRNADGTLVIEAMSNHASR
jgi:acyl-coenzyme A thioesterase PaaI-like protein